MSKTRVLILVVDIKVMTVEAWCPLDLENDLNFKLSWRHLQQLTNYLV